MPTEYTITYFNTRGGAEPARMILAYSGAVWKDNRLPFQGPGSPIPLEVKEKLRYGQMPLLEFDGKKLVQTVAITRYLAQEFGLAGKDRFESAMCDEIVDAMKDVMNLFLPHMRVKDDPRRPELLQEACSAAQQRFLSKFNAMIEDNGGYLVGKSLTWADIYIAFYMDKITRMTQTQPTGGLTALADLVTKVHNLKGIKEYIAALPEENV